jgi:hypothetical protein
MFAGMDAQLQQAMLGMWGCFFATVENIGA